MRLTDQFKFGKFKSFTLADMLTTEERRGWLEWYYTQPCTKPQYAEYDQLQKSSIKRALDDWYAKNSQTFSASDVSAMAQVQKQIADLELRLLQVEQRLSINAPPEGEKPTGKITDETDIAWEE